MKFMWIFLIKAGLTLFFVNQITSNGHSTYLRCLLWTLYINIYAFQARYDCGSGHVQSNCGIYEHNHVLKVLNNNSLLKHILNFVVLDRSYSSFHSRLGKFLASFINCHCSFCGISFCAPLLQIFLPVSASPNYVILIYNFLYYFCVFCP